MIGVSIPDHTILWDSAGLPGISAGTPAIVVNQNDSKNYVVLTHNSQIVKPDNTTVTTGHITLLQTIKGKLVWTESEWSRDEIPKGYGPLGRPNSSSAGKYSEGVENSNDLVVWTSSDDGGRGPLGYTYVFQLPQFFVDADDDQVAALRTVDLKKVRWSSITRPVFSGNGTNMYVGVTGSELRGWVGDNQFDKTANWAAALIRTSANSFDRKF